MSRSAREISFLEKIGKKIRATREKRGWSQEKLADLCELHRTYIGAVERGERNISVLNLKIIADILDVPLHQLLMK